MWKKSMAIVLACLMVLTGSSVFADTDLFADVPADDWAAPYVYDLVERGIISGYGDGTFGPRNFVQRCEYAKMLVDISGTPITDGISTPYADVPAAEWFFPYIKTSLPFITGYTSDGVLYFRPEDPATREDVTVALIKALNIDLTPYGDPTGFLVSRFSDVDTISTHNRVYVAAAVDHGYITGDQAGTFRGQDPIIRAEIVAILCRAFPSSQLVSQTNDTSAVNATLTAFFLDVGQGDCCVIELPDGKVMMIDAGIAKSSQAILDFLRNRGHSYLDYVIATHPHADHIGGMAEILNAIEVGQIYMPYASTTTKTYENLLQTILEHNIPVITAKAGVSVEGLEKAAALFTAPNCDSYKDLNNYSAVLRLQFGETTFLFAGDAESESELEMLAAGQPVDADVLKVGHHGSDTSSTSEFLQAVTPSFAIISCGAGNSYGHPKPTTLKALTDVGAAVFRTDLNGTVTVKSDGHTLNVQ